jgi:4-hydroxy-3-polyprenylbenzoate decarboxylase
MGVVVAITGASGAVYGITLLMELKKMGVKTHLILSRWARHTIELETGFSPEEIAAAADHCYPADDLSAPVASGSFRHRGMVVAPCSMKTLAAIAHGYSDNLIARAADVTIKEGRRLVLMPRETPLSPVHLENMLRLARLGVVIMPPMPAFYHHPQDLQDVILQTAGRAMDLLGIENGLVRRWKDHHSSL